MNELRVIFVGLAIVVSLYSFSIVNMAIYDYNETTGNKTHPIKGTIHTDEPNFTPTDEYYKHLEDVYKEMEINKND